MQLPASVLSESSAALSVLFSSVCKNWQQNLFLVELAGPPASWKGSQLTWYPEAKVQIAVIIICFRFLLCFGPAIFCHHINNTLVYYLWVALKLEQTGRVHLFTLPPEAVTSFKVALACPVSILHHPVALLVDQGACAVGELGPQQGFTSRPHSFLFPKG